MPFRPNVHDELTLNGVTYRIAEHPAAPGIPYGQEGRAGIVYQLLPSPTGRGAGDEGAMALKVFRARFRTPALVSQAEKLAAFAGLPGLQVARRTVLTPQRDADLLRREPDLTYAVLMPWVEGPTWQEVLLEKRPLTPQQALTLAHALAEILSQMEQHGIAHCDLSGPNVLLPALTPASGSPAPGGRGARGEGVALVDLEGLYAPGFGRPEALSSGSAGYAHAQAAAGLWSPNADRFAGAVLLAEMLGWCDPQVVQAAWGESYFDPQEMQQDSARYQALLAALQRHWGDAVARLFARAWHSETLADCPTFGEWLVALPLTPSPQPPSPLPQAGEEKGVAAQPAGEAVRAAVEVTAEIRAFMQAARRMEEQRDLESALKLYRQALGLAQGDPALRSLAREIELTVQDVQARARPISPRIEESLAKGAISLPVEEVKVALPAEEEPGIREEPYRKRPWGWVLGGLVVFALLAALVYGVNVQQQQDVVPPSPPTLPSPPLERGEIALPDDDVPPSPPTLPSPPLERGEIALPDDDVPPSPPTLPSPPLERGEIALPDDDVPPSPPTLPSPPLERGEIALPDDDVPPSPPTLPSPPPFWIEEFPTLIHAQYGQSVELSFTIRVSPHSETMTLRPTIRISKSSPGYSYSLFKEHVTPKEALISPGASFLFTTKIDTAELIKSAGEGTYTIDFLYWVEVRKGNTIYNVQAPLVDVNGKEVQAQLEVSK
jgi:hypothetical protein